MQTLTPTQIASLRLGRAVKKNLTFTPAGGGASIALTWSDDIVEGSFELDRVSAMGRDIELGSATAAELRLDLYRSEKLEGISLEGGTLTLTYEIAGTSLPGGIFTIDSKPAVASIMRIRALDNMIKFARPYVSEISYPVTLKMILEDCCDICGVELGFDGFPNDDFVVKRPDTSESTHQHMIGWIAALAGRNAYIDEEGKLQFRWYDGPAYAIEESDYFICEYAESDRQVTGLTTLTRLGSEITTGTDEYAVNLAGNLLAEQAGTDVLEITLEEIDSLSWRPILRLETVAFPHLWPGDKITVDIDGELLETIVTGHRLAVTSVIAAAGEPVTARGYATPPVFSAREQQEIIEVIRSRKIVADSVIVPSTNENLDETIMALQNGQVQITKTMTEGGLNLFTNPTFGTIALSEKTGWSDYIVRLLKKRFANETVNQMKTTLAGKTVIDFKDYDSY